MADQAPGRPAVDRREETSGGIMAVVAPNRNRTILEASEGLIPPYIPRDTDEEDSVGICLTSPMVTFKRTINAADSSGVQLEDDTADVTLIVDNRKINVHKKIFASQSDYFDKMFTSNFKEQNQDKVAINIVDLSYETLKTFADFFYTSTLDITETNVQDLLIGSSILLLEDVQEACVHFVKTMIDSENCLKLINMSSSLRLNELHSYCMNYIIKHFNLVLDKEEFVHIPFDDLLLFVKDENLFAKEHLIYDAVGKWVAYDPVGRWKCNLELLWYCRLPFILNNNEGTVKVQNFQGAKLDSLIAFRTEYRKPFQKGILLMSHYPTISTPVWLAAATEEWLNCERQNCQCTNYKAELKPPEYLSTNVLLDTGCIFSIGGEDIEHGMNAMKAAYLFNPSLGKWIYMPPMKYHRVKPCVVQMGPKVFVIGGLDKLSFTNAIEYYDLIENKWVSVRSKIKGTTSAKDGIFAARVNNLIYVICKNVAGYFDTESNEWISIAPVPTQKYGSVVCTLNNNIYVIGGHKNDVYYKCVWAYCTETKKWVSVAALNSPRSNCGVAVMNGYIYVFGGKTGPSSYSSTFEVYNPHYNTWVTSNAHLDMGRSFCDAMVIEKDSDMYRHVFENVINFIH